MKKLLINNSAVILIVALFTIIGMIGLVMNRPVITVVTAVIALGVVMTKIPPIPLLIGSVVIIIFALVSFFTLAFIVAVALVISCLFGDSLLWTQEKMSAKLLKFAE